MSYPQPSSAALQGVQGRLDFRAVTKRYGPTVALSEFTHSFAPGQVHALMGKNGSGKSTLVKLLAGVTEPTSGTISVNGEDRHFTSPHDAFAAGIVTVHQELSLVPELSVGENIFLGRLPHRRRAGFSVVDWAGLHKRAGELLADMGLAIDSRQPVSALSVGQQQVVEIVKAMSFNPSILLLDEPTSALASREVKQLFALIERLRARGVTMIYITHRMSELFEIADTCTVIRDGHYIGAVEMKATTPSAIVGMMFGDAARATRPPRRTLDRTRPVLEVRDLSRSGHFQNVSFDLYPGEILGIAGLLGAGRTELALTLFGMLKPASGTIALEGKPVRFSSNRDAIAAGVAYLSEDRLSLGLIQPQSIADNLVISSLDKILSGGLLSEDRKRSLVARWIADLGVKIGLQQDAISTLSGGNQQRVAIAKWLATDPKLLILDAPTVGVDVGARAGIFDIVARLAETGLAIILISDEVPEVYFNADRVLHMAQGRIVGSYDPRSASLAEIEGAVYA